VQVSSISQRDLDARLSTKKTISIFNGILGEFKLEVEKYVCAVSGLEICILRGAISEVLV
jgi:hypothetical protein